MTDLPETLEPYRMPWRSDHLKQGLALAPLLRRVPKNPLFLIGAAAIGVAGVLAWRNRDRIAATAGPMIDEAKAKGQSLIDDAKVRSASLIDEAKTKGEELIEQAKTTTEEVVAKATRSRKKAVEPVSPVEIH